jgi:hypothetical protein
MLNTKSLTANETIISKTKFERLAKSNGGRSQVTTPTTVFQGRKFMKELHPRDKVSSSLVLEPSGKNGVAENAVKIVTWKARGTDDPRFPSLGQEDDPELWPMQYLMLLTSTTTLPTKNQALLQ